METGMPSDGSPLASTSALAGTIREIVITPVLNGFFVRVVNHTGSHHFVVQAQESGCDAIEPVLNMIRGLFRSHLGRR